jgi:hypothetical protein
MGVEDSDAHMIVAQAEFMRFRAVIFLCSNWDRALIYES